MPNPYIKHITLPNGQGGSIVYDLKPLTLNVTGSGNGVASLTLSDYLLTATKGTFLTSHPTITTYTDTTSTVSPVAGGSFTVVDSVTRETNGHVQRINLKTVTLPSSSITVDTALSTSSTNPVENRVVTNYKPGLVNQTTKGETFGASTSALGSYASAHGIGTTASGNYQMAIGQYNSEDTNNDYAFIIGNGTKSGNTVTYSNAFTVDWGGNTTVFGNTHVKGGYIYIGSNNEISLLRYNLGTNIYIDNTDIFAVSPIPSLKYQNGADIGIVPIMCAIGTSQLTDGSGLIKTPWSRVYMRYGTTSQEGIAGLYLGNNKKAGVEDNAYGEMRIFTAGTAQTSSTSTTKPYIKILPPTLTGVVPHYSVYWPSKAGTLALEEYTVAGTYDSNGQVTIPNVSEIQFTKWVPDMGIQAAGVLRGGGTGIGNAVFSLPTNSDGGVIALYSDLTSYHPTTTWTSSSTTVNLSFGGTFEVDRVNQSSGDLDGHGHIAHGETITYKLPSLGNCGGEITPVYFANGLPVVCKTYASGATWNIVPRVLSDGTMEIGKYVDFHTSNTGTTGYDIRLSADDTNTMSLQSYGGETALQITGTLPRIKFNNTTSGKEYSRSILVGYPSATYGMNLLLEAGSNMIVSSGESGTAFYNIENKSTSYPDYWIEDAEIAYIISGSTIVMLTNCDTISDRKAFTFGSHFALPPGGQVRFRHSDGETSSGLVNGSNSTTTSRTWTLPDESGTIALVTNTDANALINTLSTSTSIPVDNDYYVSQYAGGGTTTTTYHRRPMLSLYKYLCNKRTGYVLPDGSSVTGSANNWFRIAYSTTTTAYSDIEGIFLINYAYNNGICGILKVRGRTGSTAGTFTSTRSVQWLVKDDDLDGNNICVIFANNKGSGSSTVSGTACVEIWVKATAQYQTVTCTMLSGFGRDATINSDWTWHMINDPGNTGSTSLPSYSSQTNIYATTEMSITAYDVTYKTPTPSSKVNSEWSTSSERTRLVTKGWMTYWDGSYNGSTSNLTYCNQGAFGSIVTYDDDDFVLKTGDTMSGNLTISKSSGDAYYYATRSDTGVTVRMGIGSGGTNHGLYSSALGKWIVYGSSTDVYINAHKVPTLANTNVGVYRVLHTSETAPSKTSGSININSSTTVVGNYDIIKVWVYVGSTSMIQQVDICCTTIELAQAPHYFPTATSYNKKYLHFSSNGYTLNWTTAGTSDSTNISIAKVIGVRFR